MALHGVRCLFTKESQHTYLLLKPQTCIEQSLEASDKKLPVSGVGCEKTKHFIIVTFFKVKWFSPWVIFLQWFVGDKNHACRSGNDKENHVTDVSLSQHVEIWQHKSTRQWDNVELSFLLKLTWLPNTVNETQKHSLRCVLSPNPLCHLLAY